MDGITANQSRIMDQKSQEQNSQSLLAVSDLQDVLCCMVLAERVYKKPAAEIVRVVNKFKADFGGQIVALERVQPSLDHVPHRYLLAEAGDTLFASFFGTKQYKDIMADANILQGAIFHEDVTEDIEGDEEPVEIDTQDKKGEPLMKPLKSKANQLKPKPKPAAHRGFLARAKGIPALELYRLAQKKNRKLVLCGHSLGGAVAALATLAILRVIAASSPSKDERIQVKCITFSQPPVGNSALRDYVHRKGWRHYFKTYCIPEDVIPRILSPAYFHHYNVQPSEFPVDLRSIDSSFAKGEKGIKRPREVKLKDNDGEQLVIGLSPVQNSFWRLSKLVPVEAVKQQINRFRGKHILPGEISPSNDSGTTSLIDEIDAAPQSLEIQEGSDGVSLKPLPATDNESSDFTKSAKIVGKSNTEGGNSRRWRRIPSLPSYVPFGQLYLLGSSSVEALSDAEYSKLTSVKSVITELKERLQSHSMRSYRSRFQKIYDLCMCGSSPFLGVEQLPHLQQWLGVTLAGAVELGRIVDPPVIHTATSIVPLGWSGNPGGKSGEPLKVDIVGHGLHLCTLIQAQVNGNWCSTTVESLPSMATYSSNLGLQPDLQNIRIIVGAPFRRPPKHPIVTDQLMPDFPSINTESVSPSKQHDIRSFHERGSLLPEGLTDLVIFCKSDFTTVSKKVYVRTRRVKFIGLEGAGKTSLFNAILDQTRAPATISLGSSDLEMNFDEGIAGGLCYSDSSGVNLQELNLEAARFRDELWMGVRDLSRKTDLVVLIHNLSHRIPRSQQSSASPPALSLFLNEAKSLGVPWVLAVTNKFSVSAHQQKETVRSVIQAYQASPSTTEVVNSCPYHLPGTDNSPQPWGAPDNGDTKVTMAAQKLIFAPMNLLRMPFQKKSQVLPMEGVNALCQLVQRVLHSQEEASFQVENKNLVTCFLFLQELSRERLLLELARQHALTADANRDGQGKGNSITAAAVGASLGAGLGLVLAVVMGAASALRKP